MTRLVSLLQSMQTRDEGASLVEYALLLALIAVVAIAAITLLGNNASSTLDNVADNIG